MGIEFEMKFKATKEQLETLRGAVEGEEKIYRMETTYYDTPSGDYGKKMCTLRRRMENGKSICTLKTPAGDISRREWETESDTIEEALDALCKLGVPEELLLPARQGLIPICGARFTRVAKTVILGDGEAELALDQGVLTGGGRETPLCEVEVEQKTCTREACTAYAKVLAARYGLQTEKYSKFSRALALYKGE